MRMQLPIRVLKSVPVVPKINATPSQSWAFQLQQTVGCPKDPFGNAGRVSCSELPCHELQERKCPPSIALLP